MSQVGIYSLGFVHIVSIPIQAQISTHNMCNRRIMLVSLILVNRATARTVLFNYNSDTDTVHKNIDTFMEDTEGLDDGVKMLLKNFKQNFDVIRENKKVDEIKFDEDIIRTFFNPLIIEEEESSDHVEIMKIWKFEDLQK